MDLTVADDTRNIKALTEATRRRGSLWATARAVLWSFFGVRRGRDHASDMEKLNPLHVIIMGIVGAALFVAVLITIVHWVVPG